MDCTVDVAQSINGEVLRVDVRSCQGGELTRPLENAITRAVYASSPLPEPPDPELFDRRVRIRFRPTSGRATRRRRAARALERAGAAAPPPQEPVRS